MPVVSTSRAVVSAGCMSSIARRTSWNRPSSTVARPGRQELLTSQQGPTEEGTKWFSLLDFQNIFVIGGLAPQGYPNVLSNECQLMLVLMLRFVVGESLGRLWNVS